MGIEKQLDELWEKVPEELWREHSILTMKYLPCGHDYDLIIMHNTLRDYWEQNKKKQVEQKCPIDDEKEVKNECIPYGNLFFRFNTNPTLRYHLFIQTLEHRADPIAQDHLTIMNFVDETDYAVYMNLKGSGAGIPEHVHYQGQKRRHFPLLSTGLDLTQLAKNDQFEVWCPDLINYNLIFKTKSEKARETLSQILEHLHGLLYDNGLPYNLLFDKEVVYLFPRKTEIARNIPDELKEAGMEKWQIAGQEMGHLFTAKYYQILERMTKRVLLDALKDVTLFELKEQERFEKIIMGGING